MNIFINRLLKSLPQLDKVDVKTVMYDLYETEFGIYDHIHDKSRPLASVSFHHCEDYNTASLTEEAIRTYIIKDIKNVYGLSLIEFLELPKDIIEMMFIIDEEEKANKKKLMDELEENLKK